MPIDCFKDAPLEWPRKTIAELAEIDPAYELEDGRCYPFIEMASVQEGFGGISKFDTRIWDRSGLCRFSENDIILGKITPCAENGKTALVQGLSYKYGIGSTEFFVLSPHADVVPDFLFTLVTAGPFHRRLVSRMEGSTGRLRITRDTLKKWLAVPVPNLNEQRRIAAVLKLADDAIVKVKAELEAARELKQSLMQTLFISGMPGRHSDFVETKIGPVPKSWQVKQLGEVLVSSQYGLSESMAESGRFPILRMNNIDNGMVNADDMKYIDLDDVTFKMFRLRAGDILFNRTNSMEYVGRVGIVNEDMDAVFASYLVRLVADTSQIDSWFLNFCLNSNQVKNRYRRYATPAVQQANINPRNLRKTLLAFPSLEDSDEQYEIIELFRSVDNSIISLNQKVEALLQVKKSLLQNLLTGKIRIPEGVLNV